MHENIPDIYNSLQELAWHFGNHGINGECCGNLPLVEFMALKRAYERKDCSIQDIGNYLGFSKSGATRILDRLEKKGYVRRLRSSSDGRVCCVTLTNQGIDILTKTKEQYAIFLTEILKGLEQHKVDQIKLALENLLEAVRRDQTLKPKNLVPTHQ